MTGHDPLPEWDRLEVIFEAAVALPPAERSAFLDREGLAPELRAEVESLLARAESAGCWFESLAASLPTPVPDNLEAEEDAVASPSDPLLGRLVGHYLVGERLGSGGMGVLYRARDTRLEREVALKFLPPHLGLDPEAKQRFLVEARAAAALDHPGICTIHEIGETEDGRLFIAMACYDGETLKERIARGPLPVAEAVTLAARIARALAAAHGHGIIHRDVKPANVMLTREGGVKLLDFGLAKVADATLTLPGSTPGTVAYMSPEQVRGEPVDGRSDLWSLGVVLYEMLTGTRPFRGGSDASILHAILHDPPEPMAAARPGIPEPIACTVTRLLQKNATDRYASVEELLTGLTGEVAVTLIAPAALASSPPHRRARRLALTVVGLAGIVWVGSLLPGKVTLGDAWSKVTGSAPTDRQSIAVLPFANVGGDPAHEYLSDGLSEELISALSRLRAVRVASRTSTFSLKGDRREIREIGRALNVGTILEGSVRHQGDRIRVVARLVGVKDGFPLWSATYDREMTDILAIESDIALGIATALEAQLTATDRAQLVQKPTENPEAYVLYLRGQYFWNQRTANGLSRAVDHFQRAIAADSNYALAHAGLANVYCPSAVLGYTHPRVGQEQMRTAAYRAVRMDDGLAEAHTALAAYLHVYEWDHVAAEREYRRAIELNPTYSTAHHWYAYLLSAQGRYEEALAQVRLAMAADPLVLVQNASLAMILYYLGQRDPAVSSLGETLELDPTFWIAHEGLGMIYEKEGNWAAAVAAFRLATRNAGPTRRPMAGLARVLALAGQEEEARRLVDTLVAVGTRDNIYTPQVASALYALGDTTAAFTWLEASSRQRHPDLQHAALEFGISGLEKTTRFAALLQQIGSKARRWGIQEEAR